MADTKKTASTVSEVKTEAPKAAETESEKKTPFASVKASEKAPAASSAKEKIVKSAEKVAEKAAKGAEKVAEKAAKSAEKAGKTAEKTAEKATKSAEKAAKTAEKSVKTSVKKLAKKKAPANVESTVYLQFDNKSISADSLVERVKEIWKEKKRKASDLKDVKVYVNVAESKAYYVVNGDTLGDFEI